jgi:putative transposase
MRWLHKVRLYPSCAQERALDTMLHVTRELYNALLWQRRDSWKTRRVSMSAKEQYRQLTELRAEDERFAGVYRECEDAVLHRLDLAMASFFRRLKTGEEPGYPRFKSRSRWCQIEFPHGDRAIKFAQRQARIRVPGVGAIKLRKGREVPESYGRVFLHRKNERWYAVFECHRDAEPLDKTGAAIGLDRGVAVVAALSDGTLIENPKHLERARSRVEKHAQRLDRYTVKDTLGRPMNGRDPKRRKAVRELTRAKEREANARRDYLHNVSRTLVNRYDIIVHEKLTLTTMTRSAKGTAEKPGSNVTAKTGLNRAMLDAGLGMLLTLIREKAEHAARSLISVDAKFTSQTCFECKHVAKESRKETRFRCVACGYRDHADVNAAKNILARAQLAHTRTPGIARGALHEAA